MPIAFYERHLLFVLFFVFLFISFCFAFLLRVMKRFFFYNRRQSVWFALCAHIIYHMRRGLKNASEIKLIKKLLFSNLLKVVEMLL